MWLLMQYKYFCAGKGSRYKAQGTGKGTRLKAQVRFKVQGSRHKKGSRYKAQERTKIQGGSTASVGRIIKILNIRICERDKRY